MAERPLLGEWRFDAEAAELRCGERTRRLEDRAARTLALLCRHRGEIVSKAAILQDVWNGRAVSANSVAIVIADLRRALDDDASAPRIIETVGKRGYRLVAPAPVSSPPVMTARRHRSAPHFAWLAGAIAALAAIGLLMLARPKATETPIALTLSTVRNDTGRAQYDPLAKALTVLVEDRAARLPGFVVREPAVGPGMIEGRRRLTLRSRLIIWNDTTTLSLTAVDPSTGKVAWSGMAVGQPDHIAAATIAQLADFRRKIGAGSGRSNQ